MKAVAFVLPAALLFAAMASGATLVVNCSTVSGQTELNGNIVCGQFNNLGTLSSISIVLTGGITGSITLTNNSSTPQTVSASTSTQFNVGALAGFVIVNPISTASVTTGSQTIVANTTQTFVGLSGTSSGTFADNSVFAPYTGAGNFNVPVSTLTGLTVLGGGGNIGSQQSTNGNATAVVTYTYSVSSSTPEPATYGLIGLGLAGLGLVRRRAARTRS